MTLTPPFTFAPALRTSIATLIAAILAAALSNSASADILVDDFSSTGTLVTGANTLTLPGTTTESLDALVTTQSNVPHVLGGYRSFTLSADESPTASPATDFLRAGTPNGFDFQSTPAQNGGVSLSYGFSSDSQLPDVPPLGLSIAPTDVLRVVFSVCDLPVGASLEIGPAFIVKLPPPTPPFIGPLSMGLADGAYALPAAGPQTFDIPLTDAAFFLNANGFTLDGLELGFISQPGTHFHIDSISIVSTPEPASISLLAFAIPLLLKRRH